MVEAITPAQFHAAVEGALQGAVGNDDWRVVFAGACAHYRTGSFDRGAALVAEIARIAAELGHHPDVDLRAGSVVVTTRSGDIDALSERDVAVAQRISAAARDLGVAADPTAVQTVQLTIDALVAAEVMPFWQALLGYDAVGGEDVVDPHRRGPGIWFQDMDAPRPQRNRIHVDVSVPPDQAQARIAAALAAGGRIVDDSNAPQWWTLADPEGNEADVATWQGRS